MAIQGCGNNCLKYIFFIFNLVVCIGGLVLVVVGIVALVKPEVVRMIPIIGGEIFQTAAYLAIIVGIIIFILGFLGCCGAWKENRCLLGLFFVIMLVMFIVLLVTAILAFAFKGQAKSKIKDGLIETLTNKYATGSDDKVVKSIQEGWDFVQEKFQCCGIGHNTSKGYEIWQSSKWFKSQTGSKKKYVPTSCCIAGKNEKVCTGETDLAGAAPRHDETGTKHKNPNLNYGGCVKSIEGEIEGNLLLVGGICLCILILMILAMIFSMCLCRSIGEYEGIDH